MFKKFRDEFWKLFDVFMELFSAPTPTEYYQCEGCGEQVAIRRTPLTDDGHYVIYAIGCKCPPGSKLWRSVIV